MIRFHLATCVALLLTLLGGLAQAEVILLGDSIVADIREPEFGWGELLPSFLDQEQFPILNRASSGASSKSYYNQYWTSVGWPFDSPVRDIVNPGDFVVIQFGHNDLASNIPEKAVADMDEYRSWLSTILTEVEERNAKPIFVTPPEGWAHRSSGLVGHIVQRQNHADTMKSLALDTDTPLIDLHAYSVELFGSISEEQAVIDFEAINPTTGLPTGDKTHTSESGAEIWAEFISGEFLNAVGAHYAKAPGDYNQDGDVDMADFLILSANYRDNFETPTSFLNGDSNLDGFVDLADFLVFRREFNAAVEARAAMNGVASVPEPNPATAMMLGVACLVSFRRRRCFGHHIPTSGV